MRSLLRNAALAAALTSTSLFAQAPTKPNVLVILVDDMGFSDIGCYGSEIQTPRLDALATQGIRFTQFYNTARCCPTRAALLTGVTSHEAGVGHMTGAGTTPAYQGYLSDQCVTLAEAVKPAGYFTAAVGKWHVGGQPEHWPRQRGFDRWYGSQAGGFYYKTKLGPGRWIIRDDTPISRKGENLPDDFYSTDAWGKAACEYADEAKSIGKPFMIYLAYNAPHFPLQAPADTIAKYRGTYNRDWVELSKTRFEKQKQMGLIDASLAQAKVEDDVPTWSTLSDKEKDRYDGLMSTYAACIEKMDTSVGTVIDHLKENGQLDNTLILFMSDNGGNAEGGIQGNSEGVLKDRWGGPDTTIFAGKSWAGLQNTPFRKFKHYVHEGGIASPLIMVMPSNMDAGMAGKFYREPAHLIDVMPTLLDLSGATYPATFKEKPIRPLWGTSLLPALTGGHLARTHPLFWEHEGNCALRDGDWKLVREEGEPWQLYNLANDRTEQHDLAAQEPERVKKMIAAWQARADDIGVLPWNQVQKNERAAETNATRPGRQRANGAATQAAD